MTSRAMTRKKYISVLISLSLAVAFVFGNLEADARKIKTKHTVSKITGNAKETTGNQQPSVVFTADSIGFEENIKPAIRFYGFDKTVGSSMESFFISNGLEMPIAGLEIEITYSDMKGRQLHKRRVILDSKVPAGETIRRDIKSWDTQKSFYFHQSAKPKRQATPFDAKIELISVSLTEN